MGQYKIVLGVVAVVMGFLSYIPYFRDIFKGKTKPHAFSWLVWSVLTSIAFAAQIVKQGGPGSWVNGGTAIACISVFLISLFRGEKNIKLADRLSLAGAALGLTLWALTTDPFWAVVLVCLIDAAAFIPTYRKSYHKPFEETLITYIVSTLKYAISLIALDVWSPTTVLFPASLVLTNGLFVLMLFVRRRTIGHNVSTRS